MKMIDLSRNKISVLHNLDNFVCRSVKYSVGERIWYSMRKSMKDSVWLAVWYFMGDFVWCSVSKNTTGNETK